MNPASGLGFRSFDKSRSFDPSPKESQAYTSVEHRSIALESISWHNGGRVPHESKCPRNARLIKKTSIPWSVLVDSFGVRFIQRHLGYGIVPRKTTTIEPPFPPSRRSQTRVVARYLVPLPASRHHFKLAIGKNPRDKPVLVDVISIIVTVSSRPHVLGTRTGCNPSLLLSENNQVADRIILQFRSPSYKVLVKLPAVDPPGSKTLPPHSNGTCSPTRGTPNGA
jgi:hypothetical protein